jgi:hypothetical protein
MESDMTTVDDPLAGRGRPLKLFIIFGIAMAVILVVVGYVVGTQFSSSDNTNRAAGGAASGTADDKLTKANALTACMRRNGVPNFPAPGPNGQLRILQQDKIDIGSQAFKDATNACKEYLPQGPSAQPVAPGSAPSVDTSKYVACMRQNGAPDFPDPQDNAFNYDVSTQKFKDANAKCQSLLPSGAPPLGG